MKFVKANVSVCTSLHLYMSGIGEPSISQRVGIIHLGECSVANPNLKNDKIHTICPYLDYVNSEYYSQGWETKI